MPAFYAHYRFGRDVLAALPADLREICTAHRALYDIGLHGPDIFFFYRPFFPNRITKLGNRSHSLTGTDFLLRAGTACENMTDKPAFLAYFFGFLCHLTLDTVCHPEVYRAQTYTGAGHTAIETALDRTLLLSDGIDPLHHDPCRHIRCTPEDAAVITELFPQTNARTVEKSLRYMVTCGRILYTRNSVFRQGINLLFRATGHYDFFHGMLMTSAPDTRCSESDRRLFALCADAVPAAVERIRKASIYIESKTEPDPVFRCNFKGPVE